MSDFDAEKQRLQKWHDEQVAAVAQLVAMSDQRIVEAQAALDKARAWRETVAQGAKAENDRVAAHLQNEIRRIDAQIVSAKLGL